MILLLKEWSAFVGARAASVAASDACVSLAADHRSLIGEFECARSRAATSRSRLSLTFPSTGNERRGCTRAHP
jgi:hypothetical protein